MKARCQLVQGLGSWGCIPTQALLEGWELQVQGGESINAKDLVEGEVAECIVVVRVRGVDVTWRGIRKFLWACLSVSRSAALVCAATTAVLGSLRLARSGHGAGGSSAQRLFGISVRFPWCSGRSVWSTNIRMY